MQYTFKEKLEFFWNDWGESIIVVALIIAAIFACIGSLVPMCYQSCKQKAETMEVNFEWKFWGGCFFEIEEGMFIHEDNYRYGEIDIQN